MPRRRAAVFWSGGKDSALALDRARGDPSLEVAALVTTFEPPTGRVAMHGVPIDLVEMQAQSLGLPLARMSMDAGVDYVRELRRVFDRLSRHGIEAAVFGDIFLEDLRAWREEILAGAGVQPIFPLWGADTRALTCEFVERGFRGVVCCVEDPALPAEAAGRELDASFFRDLPAAADPCGENGEYHSFVYDGPGFARPVAFARGAVVYRPLGGEAGAPDEPRISTPSAPAGTRTRGFWFVDLAPAASTAGVGA